VVQSRKTTFKTLVDGIPTTVTFKHLPNDYGLAEPESGEVTISEELLDDPEQLARALIHEFTHLVLYTSGWSDMLGDHAEEAMCKLNEKVWLAWRDMMTQMASKKEKVRP
jgi:hypothetical protein